MARPIAFGNYQFRTKKSATEEARRRINQYEAGDRLSRADEEFFASLFTLHSDYLEKKGSGIDHIKVENDFHNNRCLYIHRIDGSSIDCSWVHCIQPASQKAVTSMAFRRSVKSIVMAYKEAQLNVVKECPELGTPLTYENSHVSYTAPSFEYLLADFLSQEHIQIEAVGLTNPKPEDLDQRGILSDDSLSKSWQRYHQENANLRLLSQEANLRRLKS